MADVTTYTELLPHFFQTSDLLPNNGVIILITGCIHLIIQSIKYTLVVTAGLKFLSLTFLFQQHKLPGVTVVYV